jgi:dTDP-4-amino-4,6-dideoxygalactose transaminase
VVAARSEHRLGPFRAEESRMTTDPATVWNPPAPEGLRVVEDHTARRSRRPRRLVRFVDLQAEYRGMKSELDAAISRVLERSDFVLGEAVRQLEEAFAGYCGVQHAIGVDSGFSALELSLRAMDIGPGDEVITAANTFYATAAAICSCGATPVLVDADPTTATLDPARLEAAITPATRAVIPVHLYGHPADMERIGAIATANGLRVLEDACQAHGARYRSRRTGGLGDAAAYSFYPSKNLGAFGDGGIVVTDDADLAERLRMLRNLGTRERNRHELRGFNRRLDTLQAAVVHAKLPALDDANDRRRWAAASYERALAGLPLELPSTAPWAEHVFHLYVIQTPERDRLRDHLEADGIETGIHYPFPIHLQPAHADLGYRAGDFPVTEGLAERILSLPMHPALTDDDLDHVTGSIMAFFG